jgi:hypothetical protein
MDNWENKEEKNRKKCKKSRLSETPSSSPLESSGKWDEDVTNRVRLTAPAAPTPKTL